jgi:Cys-rich repeat protein
MKDADCGDQHCILGTCTSKPQNHFARQLAEDFVDVVCNAMEPCLQNQTCFHGNCLSCLDDEDCGHPRSCVQGRCILPVAFVDDTPITKDCTEDSHCVPTQACDVEDERNICVACTENSQCYEGQFCKIDTRECVDADGECLGNDDCSAGRFCAFSQCVYCTRDSECRVGQICHDYNCRYCSKDEDCNEGKSCVDGSCTDCSFDVECAYPKICSDGTCILPAGFPQPFNISKQNIDVKQCQEQSDCVVT